jgi:formylglycine-generating enzyme
MLLGLLAERECLEALYDETPVHSVRISPAFYMGRTEVTVGQFRRFLEASG